MQENAVRSSTLSCHRSSNSVYAATGRWQRDSLIPGLFTLPARAEHRASLQRHARTAIARGTHDPAILDHDSTSLTNHQQFQLDSTR